MEHWFICCMSSLLVQKIGQDGFIRREQNRQQPFHSYSPPTFACSPSVLHIQLTAGCWPAGAFERVGCSWVNGGDLPAEGGGAILATWPSLGPPGFARFQGIQFIFGRSFHFLSTPYMSSFFISSLLFQFRPYFYPGVCWGEETSWIW